MQASHRQSDVYQNGNQPHEMTINLLADDQQKADNVWPDQYPAGAITTLTGTARYTMCLIYFAIPSLACHLKLNDWCIRIAVAMPACNFYTQSKSQSFAKHIRLQVQLPYL
jgi:hypothetical protein